MMMRPSFAYLLAGLAAMTLVIGCGGDDETLPEPSDRTRATEEAAAPAKPRTEPAPSKAPAADNSRPPGVPSVADQLAESVELPDYFPEDAPVYPGAKPSQVQQRGNGRVSVIYGADTTPEDAAQVMVEASEAKGWSIQSNNALEDGYLISGSKNGRNLMVLTNRIEEAGSDAVTIVAISVDP